MLINNAGFGTGGYFPQLDLKREKAMITVHVEAVLRLTHSALQNMLLHNRGAIINVSSGVALYPTPYHATYGATKAFINSFTEAIAEELRGTAIRVQTLCPGFTRTEFQQRADIETRHIPSILWMEADKVVEQSLQHLQKNTIICIPGFLNKFQKFTTGPLSRTIARRLIGYAGRQLSEDK